MTRDPKTMLWEVRHDDEIWSERSDEEPVGVFIASGNLIEVLQYIVNMHNTEMDKADVKLFCFDSFLKDLRKSEG